MTHAPILFIAPTRIGDAVLSTSVLEHIMQQYPDAPVDIVTGSLSAPLFEGLPRLGTLHAIDKRKHSMHWPLIWWRTVKKRYATVVDMRNSMLSYLLNTGSASIFRGHSGDEPLSKYEQFSAFLKTDALPYPTLWPRASDTAFATQLCGPSNILAFAPIANWPPKEWPIDRFIELAKGLLERMPNSRPLLICAPHEQPRIQPMIDALASHYPITLCDGSAHLLSVFACLQRAKLFVGNDSGIMHMAAAAGIPTFGIFGPTPVAVYRPIGAKAHTIAADNGELASITVKDVLTKIASKLSE